MATTRSGDWIETFSGGQFWPLDPRPEDVAIEDIAHALSNLCRFAGHVRRFYSVAQHSVHVARLVEQAHPDLAFAALLHDAPEAYVVNLPRPIKRVEGMGAYRAAETRVWLAIATAFGLPLLLPDAVHHADDVLLATEMRDLLPPRDDWQPLPDPLPEKIVPLAPEMARAAFLHEYDRLRGFGQ